MFIAALFVTVKCPSAFGKMDKQNVVDPYNGKLFGH